MRLSGSATSEYSILLHVHKHGSDGRAGPEGSVNTGPWMKVTVHGYVRRLCSTHGQRKGRGLCQQAGCCVCKSHNG